MNNDNLEETKRLNKQSADNKNARHISNSDMSDTSDVNLDEVHKKEIKPAIDKKINGISESAKATMSSNTLL